MAVLNNLANYLRLLLQSGSGSGLGKEAVAASANEEAMASAASEDVGTPAPSTTTTNTKNAPASLSALQAYLKSNNVAYKDGDDYLTALNTAFDNKKIDQDTQQRGKLLVDRYLADAQAQSALGVKQAEAENTARINTAYNDFLGKKLSSYLQEVQSNAGLEGYDGVTKGQAIDIANLERNAQQEVQSVRDTDKAAALQEYQSALMTNTKDYNDADTQLDATLAERDENDYNGKLSEVKSIVENALDDKSKISQSKWDETLKYIDGLGISDNAKTNLKNYFNTAYKNNIISDKQAAAETASAKKAEIKALTRDNIADYESKMSDEDKTAYATELSNQKASLYKCTVSSGAATYGNTLTLNMPGGSGFKNDNTTITLHGDPKATTTDDAKFTNAANGQVFMKDGAVYIKGKKSDGSVALLRVIDYAGDGAYDRLKRFYAGSYYDLG